jgi:hypothetical protein
VRIATAIALAATLALAACGDDEESSAPSRPSTAATVARGADPVKGERALRAYLTAAASGDRDATCAAATPRYATSQPGCVPDSLATDVLSACADAPAVEGVPNPSGRIPPVIGKGRPNAPYVALRIEDGLRSAVCWTSAKDFVWILVAPDARIDMVSSGLDAEAHASR